jgi:hypothetical protein
LHFARLFWEANKHDILVASGKVIRGSFFKRLMKSRDVCPVFRGELPLIGIVSGSFS